MVPGSIQPDRMVSICQQAELTYTAFHLPACCVGNALLYLAGHSQCGLGSQMVCYQTLGMKVKGCQVKLWSHKGQHQARRPCWGVSLHANVTGKCTYQGPMWQCRDFMCFAAALRKVAQASWRVSEGTAAQARVPSEHQHTLQPPPAMQMSIMLKEPL